jgi:hypothetical protein
MRQVWGVGGEEAINEAMAARGKTREIVAENIQKARKVRVFKPCTLESRVAVRVS